MIRRIKVMEIPKFYEPYNHKLDTRMIINSNIYRDKYCSYHNNVWVYDGKLLPTTPEQEEIVNSKRIYNLWKNQGITVTSIVQASKIFNIMLDEDIILRLKTMLDEIKDLPPFELACRIYIFFVDKGIFKIYSTKFAIIAFNSILVRNNFLPIIIYTDYAVMLMELICAGLTIESFQDLIVQNCQNSLRYNTKHSLVPQENVIQILKENKQTICLEFGVKKLYLTGSYALNQETQYSDLDIMVEIDDSKKEKSLEKFVCEKVNLPVDIFNINERFARCQDNQTFKLEVF